MSLYDRMKKLRGSGYWNKKVFRAALATIILLFLVGMYLEGFRTGGIYYRCDSPSCENPFYTGDFKNLELEEKLNVQENCNKFFCNQQRVFKGFEVGSPPNSIIDNFGVLSALIVLFSIILNHIIYMKNPSLWGD